MSVGSQKAHGYLLVLFAVMVALPDVVEVVSVVVYSLPAAPYNFIEIMVGVPKAIQHSTRAQHK